MTSPMIPEGGVLSRQNAKDRGCSEATKALKSCEVCGGTGWQWLMRSWFTADGYRREHCGICSGTGKSDYRGTNRKFVNRQAELRFTAPFRAKADAGVAVEEQLRRPSAAEPPPIPKP